MNNTMLSVIMQKTMSQAQALQGAQTSRTQKSQSLSATQPAEAEFAGYLREAVGVETAPVAQIAPRTLDIPLPEVLPDSQTGREDGDDVSGGYRESDGNQTDDFITPQSAVALEDAALAEQGPSTLDYEELLSSIWNALSEVPQGTSSDGLSSISDNILLLLLSMHPDLKSSDSSVGFGGGVDSVLTLLASCLTQGQNENTESAMDCIRALVDKLPEQQAGILRRSLMDSENVPEVLDKIDTVVFGVSPVAVAGSGTYPYEAWRKCEPSVVSNTDSRNAALYRAVIDQFDVENNGRYKVNKKGTGDTYCNIFMWDVTSAMGAEIPHYIDKQTKEPRVYPDTRGAMELNANATYDWLTEHGPDYGWISVSAEQAQMYANQGRPAVTAKKNPGGIGHVQVVCPSQNGAYDPIKGVTVAQAGSRLRNYTYISEIYGGSLSKVAYFVHL